MSAEIVLESLVSANNPRRHGGKAVGLCRLTRFGAPTPPGCVVAADLFDAQVGRLGLTHDIASLLEALPRLTPQQLHTRSDALRAALLGSTLTPVLSAALGKLLRNRRPGTRFAVRSSAVGEDGLAASFAGQFDSVLGVTSLQELDNAIRRVWASTFNVRALRYGHHRKCLVSRMAVVIQEQVRATVSGVLFTRNPSNPAQDEMVFECCAGLGDRLVSGEITPTRGRISRDSLHVQYEESDAAGERAETVEPSEPSEPSGPTDQFASPDLPPGLLAENSLHDLARHAHGLELDSGAPQDIEWCVDSNSRLMFVQCRPLTTTVGNAASHRSDRAELWTNANIAENYPDPVVPLLSSFVARGYAGYFRGLGRAFGISARDIAAMAPAFDEIVGIQAGRLYYNLSKIHTVLNLAPGGRWLAQSFNLFTGSEGMPATEQLNQTVGVRIVQGARIGTKVAWQYLWVKRRVGRFEKHVDEFAENSDPKRLPGMSLSALADLLHGFLDIRLNKWTDAALADTAAMVCYGALKALLERWLTNRDQTQLQNDLLQGLPGLASAAPVEKLWDLAQQARSDRNARSVLKNRSAASALDELRNRAPQFHNALRRYLEQWGFRYSGELMLTQATPAESPETVIRLLQTYLKEPGEGPAQLTARRAMARRRVTDDTAAQLTRSSWLRAMPVPTRARCFRTLLACTQGAIRLRERARMKQALLYTRLRRIALAIGVRLVTEQVLDNPEDVFYLTIDELLAVSSESAAMAVQTRDTARATVADRRADLKVNEALNPPDQLSLTPGEQWSNGGSPGAGAAPADEPEYGQALTGTGACGGAVTGPAAVVLDVTQVDSLPRGTVLVTRQTDPGWASLFFLVKGLVVERGGMLSHGAIIAREYGIPAVVGVNGATRRIRCGDSLHVDGTRGQVRWQRG